jgi:hypothetical protein
LAGAVSPALAELFLCGFGDFPPLNFFFFLGLADFSFAADFFFFAGVSGVSPGVDEASASLVGLVFFFVLGVAVGDFFFLCDGECVEFGEAVGDSSSELTARAFKMRVGFG